MSQLSFVDAFNMSREGTGSKNVIQNAQSGSGYGLHPVVAAGNCRRSGNGEHPHNAV